MHSSNSQIHSPRRQLLRKCPNVAKCAFKKLTPKVTPKSRAVEITFNPTIRTNTSNSTAIRSMVPATSPSTAVAVVDKDRQAISLSQLATVHPVLSVASRDTGQINVQTRQVAKVASMAAVTPLVKRDRVSMAAQAMVEQALVVVATVRNASIAKRAGTGRGTVPSQGDRTVVKATLTRDSDSDF